VLEVALCSVLLVEAGLFAGSFAHLLRIPSGFDFANVLVVDVGLRWQPGRVSEVLDQGQPYVLRMLDAVRQVPGVEAAAAVNGGLPFSGQFSNTRVSIPGQGVVDGEGGAMERRTVTPDYLRLLRVPLVRGRHLSEDDRADAPPIIVINQTAARRYWPGEDPIGQRLVASGEERTVVGVVGDIRAFGPEAPVRAEGYVPLAQRKVLGATLVMRTAGDPIAILPAVKAAIWSVSADQRLSGTIFTLEGYMDRLIAKRRVSMALLAVFGVIGLAISAAGVYGVMAYLVAQRTSEIGVRLALGATPLAIVWMVLRQAALLVGAGLAVGSGVAWAGGAAAKSFLFQVEPTDPRVFGAALALLALSGLAASFVPARRAAMVDPISALRQDR
jgi:putative ABC transport system permease protein